MGPVSRNGNKHVLHHVPRCVLYVPILHGQRGGAVRACWAWFMPLENGDRQDKHLYAPVLRGAQHVLCYVLRQVLHVRCSKFLNSNSNCHFSGGTFNTF